MLRDLSGRQLIACGFGAFSLFVIIVLISYKATRGSEVVAEKTGATHQTKVSSAPAHKIAVQAVRTPIISAATAKLKEEADAEVERLNKLGLLHRVDTKRGRVHVNKDAWVLTDLATKEDFADSMKTVIRANNGQTYNIMFVDMLSGETLATMKNNSLEIATAKATPAYVDPFNEIQARELVAQYQTPLPTATPRSRQTPRTSRYPSIGGASTRRSTIGDPRLVGGPAVVGDEMTVAEYNESRRHFIYIGPTLMDPNEVEWTGKVIVRHKNKDFHTRLCDLVKAYPNDGLSLRTSAVDAGYRACIGCKP